VKINVIGASGTGKTTLAKAVAGKFQRAHFDSDDYYHYPTDPPFQKQRSPEDRLNLLMSDLNINPSWVLSGGAGVWSPAPPVDYSLVVFLYLSPAIRLERLRQREVQLYGKRVLSGGDMETDHKEFMRWTAGYDDGSAEGANTLPCHSEFLLRVGGPVLRLEGSLTTREQIEQIRRKLEEHE
jgi:adenylate kinase family enzyme